MSIEYPCVYWSDGICKKLSDDKVTSWCVEGPCGDQRPSNADRIRQMSDFELAKEIENAQSGIEIKNPKNIDYFDCILEWLQQPAEGE